MAESYTSKIDKLKRNFKSIISMKDQVHNLKTEIQQELTCLKKVYTELSNKNKKKVFLFCLDSFFFQFKTFMMEMENIDKTRIMLNNRMYCDYFKLYGLIANYIKENVKDLEINDDEIKTFPPYKDLEPFLEYKMDNLKDLHENTLFLINKLHDKVVARNDDIDDYNVNHKIGFTISNFLNTLEYENTILKEQISLYINYTAFFQISQKKHLSRLLSKFDDFHKEIQTCLSNNTMYSINDIEEETNDAFYIDDMLIVSEPESEPENIQKESVEDNNKDIETNKDPDTISEQNTISEKTVVTNDVIPVNKTEDV